MRPGLLLAMFALCLGAACATRTTPPARTAAEPRIKDSAPEKLAAQPGVDRESQPGNVDQRFGTESARARREEDARRRAADADRARDARIVPEPQRP